MGEDPSSDGLVGGTIFVRSRNIELLIPCERLFLKFEGGNPTGTQKDRVSTAVVQNAAKMGYDEIGIGTCGNFGASLAFFSKEFGLKSHVFIPADYKDSRVGEIQEYGGIIHRVDGTYEDAIEISSEEAETWGWYNANPGKNGNSEVSLNAYAKISVEIFTSLGRVPDIVSVPVGNGTTIAGIYHGFKYLHDFGKTDKVPKMIAASTLGGNPVVESFSRGWHLIRDLKPDEIKETPINEPLVSWHSFDGQLALNALYESNGLATYVSDAKMKEFARILMQEEGLSVLPASASSLAALSTFLRGAHSPQTCVAILTGRHPYYIHNNHKNRNTVNSHLPNRCGI